LAKKVHPRQNPGYAYGWMYRQQTTMRSFSRER